MTYKLFDTILAQRLCAGDLVRPDIVFDPDQSEKRELFMPPALRQTLRQVHPRSARDFAANIRAYLGRYIKDIGIIDNEDYMKSWKEDVFELRVQNQKRRDRIRVRFESLGRAGDERFWLPSEEP